MPNKNENNSAPGPHNQDPGGNNPQAGSQALNLSLQGDGPPSAPPAEEVTAMIHQGRRPVPPTPSNADDINLIETIQDEENIYDNVHKSSGSEASGSQKVTQVLKSFQELEQDEQDKLIEQLQLERTQSLYPTSLINEELNKMQDAVSDVEEITDVLEHHLGTVQVQQDDLKEAVDLLNRKIEKANQEVDISLDLNKHKLKEIRVKRAHENMQKIKRGEISDEKEIGKVMKEVFAITQKTDQDVIYSQIKKGKTKKVSYEEADEITSDDFQDATDGTSESSEEEDEEEEEEEEDPPEIQRRKKKKKILTKKKKKIQNEGDVKKENKKKKKTSPDKDSKNSGEDEDDFSVFSQGESLVNVNKQTVVFVKMKNAHRRAQQVLNSKQAKSQTHLDDAKQELKEARKNYEAKAPSLKSLSIQEIEELEAMYSNIKMIVNDINEKIEIISRKKEAVKNGPKPQIPNFYCNASQFLQFKKEFDTITKCYSEQSKMVALRNAIKPRNHDERREINKLFSNCTKFKMLDKALTRKFGHFSILFPRSLKYIRTLKVPRNPTEEISNILDILEFWNLCKSHKQTSKFDSSVYVDTHDKLLKEHTDDLKNNPLKKVVVIVEKPKKEKGPESDTDSDSDLSDEDDEPDDEEENYDMRDYIKRLKRYLKDDYKDQNKGGKPNKSHFEAFSTTTGKVHCNLCSGSHYTDHCSQLNNKSIEQKRSLLMKKNICFSCLYKRDSKHPRSNCHMRKKNGRDMNLKCNCGSNLKFSICCKQKPQNKPPQSTNAKIVEVESAAITVNGFEESCENEDEYLMVNGVPAGETLGDAEVVRVKAPDGEVYDIMSIHDTQSKACIFADELLPLLSHTEKAMYSIGTVNNSQVVQGGKGTLTILNEKDEEVTVEGLVMPLKTRPIKKVTIKCPPKWKKFNLPNKITNNSGPVKIIFGLDILSKNLNPEVLAQDDGLKLSRSRINKKPIISGYNKELMISENSGDKQVHTDLLFTHAGRVEPQDLHTLDKHLLELLNPSSFAINKLSICDDCALSYNCSKCKFNLKTKNPIERHEEALLSDSCHYDEKSQKWTVDPPMKPNIAQLPSYKEESLQQMKKLEKRIKMLENSEEIVKDLDKTVEDHLKKGNYRFEEDVKADDPAFPSLQENFSVQNYTLKDSESTRTRLVHNFSFKRGNNISYNETQLKGSSLNNKLYFIMLSNRAWKFQILGDCEKYYNSCGVSPRIAALQKFWWKRGGLLSSDPFVVICSFVLQFGAVFSQCLSNLVKHKTSTLFIKPVSEHAHQCVERSYTDDLAAVGQTQEEAKDTSIVMEKGLLRGGFSIKKWIPSFDIDPGGFDPGGTGEIPSPGSTLSFGMIYIPKTDKYKFKISLNLQAKRRGKKPQESEIKNIEDFKKHLKDNGLSKRECIRLSHSVWDCLNLLYPIKVNLHLLYRTILIRQPGLKWESKISSEFNDQWVKVIKQILDIKDLEVDRCGLPKSYKVGGPISLIVFVDGSGNLSLAKSFARSPTEEENLFDVSFITSSFKLGELGPNFAVKNEFIALVLGTRQIEFLLHAWDNINFSEILMISDSKVVLGAVHSLHARLKLYYAEKTLEAQKVIFENKVKLFFCNSEDNLADPGSKMNLDVNHVLTPQYWNGGYLQDPFETWPVEPYKFKQEDIEKLNSPKMSLVASLCTNVEEYFLNKLFRKDFSFAKTVRIICLVKIAVRKLIKHFNPKSSIVNIQIPDVYEDVKLQLFSLAQPSPSKCSGLKRKYEVTKDEKENIILLTRPFAADKKIIQQSLICVDGEHLVGRKLLKSYHVHCSSIESELAKMLDDGVFIIKSRPFLTNLQKTCVTCAKLRKITLEARLGPSFQELASQTPVFFYSMSDITGPWKLRVKRSIAKVYIYSQTCLWSRFSCFLPLFDLTSNSVLMCLKSAAYITGGNFPKFLFSDWGKNIISLQSLDSDQSKTKEKIEANNLEKVLSENNIKMILSAPYAAHRQGLIERLHRELKRTIKRSNLHHKTFEVSEFTHLCHYLTYVVNNRPLNLKYSHQTVTVLTSNKLVFGNRQNVFNPEKIDLNLEDNRLYRRLADLEDQLKNWRNLWRESYLTQTKLFTKWKKKDDPLPKNSVVLVTDHFNTENNYNTIATVNENISPRTYLLDYIKTPAKLDSNNKIITPALMSTLTRSAQSLVYLCGPDEDKPVNIDPFSITPKLPPPAVTEEKQLNDPLLDDIEAAPLPVDPKDEILPDETKSVQADKMMKEAANAFQNSIQDPDESNIIDVTEEENIDDRPVSQNNSEKGTVKTLLRFVPDEEAHIVQNKTQKNKKRRKPKKY